MYKLKLIVYCSITLSVFGCQKNTEATKENSKPNILFILVDDLGYHDLGVTGSTFYETPNVDKLANEGMMFTNGYAASRVCSPSRASIMTGKFTARHGITDWIGAKAGEDWRTRNRHDKLLPADYVMELPQEDITIAEAFKNNGYKTFFAGKWHLGDKGSYPEDHGFDINKGGFHRGGPSGGFFAPFNNPKLENRQKGENLTMRLANETADFIAKHKDSTFFAFLSFYAVHAPIQTTQEKWSKYRKKGDSMGIAKSGYEMERVLPIRRIQDNPIYGGLVETMDDAVGVVLKALKDNGIDDNTIVVFTSDNGGVASGDHYATSNLPLRGGKGYQWEGGIKEPFFIKVPWLEGVKTSKVPVVSTDLYPTLLDLANLPLKTEQHLDGVSLRPILEGKQTDFNRPLFWHYPHYGNQGGEPSSIIQKEGWKLIHYWEDGREELFKLPSSENYNENVIAQHSEIAKNLSDELLTWLNEVNAKYPITDTEFNQDKRKKRLQSLVDKKLPNLEKQRLEVLSPDFEPNMDWWGSQITVD
ncbi:sulfatase [Hyunsoonleella pacifica]|uniref:Sulfatase n=1 Tax=Hyunsoonleella pacifica TaxID=1080224 RepID=A0A4Q9FTU6_9FLAO|nr:sulfatase [Hyunsoonleella pacifica]TBN18749.1 sulfatase [Hyunsoonleella pacifica]GGD04412.1 sulfatase [Hyunsoonleella pacifica]